MKKPKWHIKEDVFVTWLNARKMTYQTLASDAGIAQGSISNAISQEGCTLGIIEEIGWTLGMRDWPDLLTDDDRKNLSYSRIPPPDGSHEYDWDHMTYAAEAVGGRVFDQNGENGVLTFPGPSLIFCGLLLAKGLPNKEAIVRTPVYTAIFVAQEVSLEKFPNFDSVETRTGRFKILVPKALQEQDPEQKRRIVVVDDTIISGLTMDALRSYFLRTLKYEPERIKFACAVCHDDRAKFQEICPEFHIRESTRDFSMPWGKAFCFEDCFPPKRGSPRGD